MTNFKHKPASFNISSTTTATLPAFKPDNFTVKLCVTLLITRHHFVVPTSIVWKRVRGRELSLVNQSQKQLLTYGIDHVTTKQRPASSTNTMMKTLHNTLC